MARRFTRRSTPQRLGRLARDPFAFGSLHLAENPNAGKRHSAKLTDAFLVELAECESRAYSPLTVKTPLRDSRGRRNPRMGHSSYTV